MLTPWGMSQQHVVIEPGLHDVSTASHGGFLVSKSWADKHLTNEAKEAGWEWGNYYAFEEDCDWAIVVFEHPTPEYQKVFLDPLAEVYAGRDDFSQLIRR